MRLIVDAYWRAANYLSVGQIYPHDNPPLRKPLTLARLQSRSPDLTRHYTLKPNMRLICGNPQLQIIEESERCSPKR